MPSPFFISASALILLGPRIVSADVTCTDATRPPNTILCGNPAYVDDYSTFLGDFFGADAVSPKACATKCARTFGCVSFVSLVGDFCELYGGEAAWSNKAGGWYRGWHMDCFTCQGSDASTTILLISSSFLAASSTLESDPLTSTYPASISYLTSASSILYETYTLSSLSVSATPSSPDCGYFQLNPSPDNLMCGTLGYIHDWSSFLEWTGWSQNQNVASCSSHCANLLGCQSFLIGNTDEWCEFYSLPQSLANTGWTDDSESYYRAYNMDCFECGNGVSSTSVIGNPSTSAYSTTVAIDPSSSANPSSSAYFTTSIDLIPSSSSIYVVSTSSAACSPPQNLKCGVYGYINNWSSYLQNGVSSSVEACRASCANLLGCRSFLFRLNGFCEMYSLTQTLANTGWVDNAGSWYQAYDIDCFGCGDGDASTSAPSIPSTSAIFSTSIYSSHFADPLTASVNPTSSASPSGSCNLKSPLPDTGPVCGPYGYIYTSAYFIVDLYDAQDTTIEGCADACTQHSGCLSFAIRTLDHVDWSFCELLSGTQAQALFQPDDTSYYQGFDLSCFECSGLGPASSTLSLETSTLLEIPSSTLLDPSATLPATTAAAPYSTPLSQCLIDNALCGLQAFANSASSFLLGADSGEPITSVEACASFCAAQPTCGGFYWSDLEPICQPFSGTAAAVAVLELSPFYVYDLSCVYCRSSIPSTSVLDPPTSSLAISSVVLFSTTLSSTSELEVLSSSQTTSALETLLSSFIVSTSEPSSSLAMINPVVEPNRKIVAPDSIQTSLPFVFPSASARYTNISTAKDIEISTMAPDEASVLWDPLLRKINAQDLRIMSRDLLTPTFPGTAVDPAVTSLNLNDPPLAAIVLHQITAPPASVTTKDRLKSTVYTTLVQTITSCAPTVPNCAIGDLTTVTIAVSTTIYPPIPDAYTKSTIYQTVVETITQCPPVVTDCPIGSLATKTVAISTTICRIAGNTKPASEFSGARAPAQALLVKPPPKAVESYRLISSPPTAPSPGPKPASANCPPSMQQGSFRGSSPKKIEKPQVSAAGNATMYHPPSTEGPASSATSAIEPAIVHNGSAVGVAWSGLTLIIGLVTIILQRL